MGLSHDIISEFVRITNDKKEKPKEGIVYGVVAKTSDGNYVKIDGSDLITPAETTTEVQDGERVTVMIKDHTATITGNVTSPSANSNSINKKFESVSDKIGTFELIVADKISANELEVYKATIDVLIAGKATIQDLEVVNATIEHLYAQNATIENLVANKASIKDLDVVNATIENLKAKDAEIEHAVIDNLEATLADIKVLNADFAQIRTLVNGNLTSDNILSFNITSDKVTMEDAFIKDAMIDNISAAKINAGKINTNNVTIGSEDGGMLITGSTQQFVDKDGNVRIQIGRDAKGDFTFILYGEDGVGQLINQNGITASAISDGLIVNDMVSDKAAISGEKLDISSVITEINNDNSTTIKSNKIYLNEQEQSLEVAFNSLKTQVETIKDITVSGDLTSVIDRVQANTTEIEVNKERINALILEDSIIKKQVTDLEGDVVETSTTLASKYSELDQTIEGFKTSVADTYATKSIVNDLSNNLSTNYSTTSAMNSAINQKVDEINLSISETYATNETVSDINDNLLKNYSTTSVMNSTINQKVDEIGLSISETYATISNVNDINDKLLTEYPTITQMDSAITLKTGEIASTVAKKEIQNIQVGGKNIIRNGNFEDSTHHWYYERFSGIDTTSFAIWEGGEWCLANKKQVGLQVTGVDDSNRTGEWTFRQGISTTVGQTYTVSYLIAGHRSNKHVSVRRGDDWGYLGSKYYGEIYGGTNINGWTYDSITFVAETPETGIWFSLDEIYTGDNGVLWVTDVCCVEGNIPHRFMPNIDEYPTNAEMNSAIIQKADEIALTVAKKEIQNIQVGGVNLISGTKTLTGAGLSGQIVETYKGCNVIHESNDNGSGYKDVISYSGLKLEPSTEYTLSFWAKGGGFITSYLYPSAVESGYHHNFENRTTNKEDGSMNTDLEEGTWKRYAITWKTESNISESKYLIVARIPSKQPGAWCYVSAPKFEKGNKPTDWSESPLEYSTTAEMNSAIIQKANEITSTVNMTKLSGVELLPQGFRRNSKSGYNTINNYGSLYINQWGLYCTDIAFVVSDFIAIDRTLPIEYYFSLQNVNGYSPMTYIGIEQFNWRKQEVAENAGTIYWLSEKFTGTKHISGTQPANSLHGDTYFIRLRWLVNWDRSEVQESYIHEASIKQLRQVNTSTQIAQMSDSITSTVSSIEKIDGRMSSAESKITQNSNSISSAVSSINTLGGRMTSAESKITQNANSITSTVSSVNGLGTRMSSAETKITQNANNITTKVDVNGVKSTIQQNPESVRIGFNGISDYFDLTSARLRVGHTDGSYTEIGQNGVMYYANGSGNRYHSLIKQGWLGQISGTSWSRTITLPSEFKGKTFSVIVSVTEVNAVNTHDVIKHFKVTVPHNTVNYTNGTFVINMSALAYYVPGQQSATAIQTDVSWIAIC